MGVFRGRGGAKGDSCPLRFRGPQNFKGEEEKRGKKRKKGEKREKYERISKYALPNINISVICFTQIR